MEPASHPELLPVVKLPPVNLTPPPLVAKLGIVRLNTKIHNGVYCAVYTVHFLLKRECCDVFGV